MPIQKQDLERIEFGNQQLLFDFEEDKQREEEIVLSCISDRIEEIGYAVLDDIVLCLGESQVIPIASVLQHVFRFAVEQKLHFLLDDHIIEPRRAEQELLAPSERRISIIPAKLVEDSVFQDVKQVCRDLSEDASANHCESQYELSRLLVAKIRRWKGVLRSYVAIAQEPLFPFEKEIANGLGLIETLSGRLDAFSLIHAFHDHTERIRRLSGEVEMIHQFYGHHMDFWKELVASYKLIRDQLQVLSSDSWIGDNLAALEPILLSPAPSDRISDARMLLDQLIRRCREILSAKIGKMTEEMRKHCDVYQASPDMRNRSLHSLRASKQSIDLAPTINSAHEYLIEAQETFDGFLDELMTLSN
ncbi:MAG: hypothetical protein V3S89_14025 [Desulfobacterales bacterium]